MKKIGEFIFKNVNLFAVLILFIIGAVFLFTIEIQIGPQNPKIEGIFNLFEFILSLGIGWVLQSFASKVDFENNLRKYAYSAYRRISDIQKSVNRLKRETESVKVRGVSNTEATYDVFRVIADEMTDTVNSSIEDWGDIIGDDLRKKDRLEELKSEETNLRIKQLIDASNLQVTKSLNDVKSEISRLRDELPYSSGDDSEYPREGRTSGIVAEKLLTSIKEYEHILLKFSFDTSISKDKFVELLGESKILFFIEQNMFKLYFEIFDQDKNILGEIQNPYSEVYNNDYIVTLMDFLSSCTIPFTDPSLGPAFFTISGIELYEWDEGEKFITLKVPIGLETVGVG